MIANTIPPSARIELPSVLSMGFASSTRCTAMADDTDQNDLPETMISPFDGTTMRRGVRPVTMTFGGESMVIDLPGYYPENGGDGIHVGKDLAVTDEMLAKARAKQPKD